MNSKPKGLFLPNAIVEIKMTGNICLSSIESYPVNYVVNNKKLEASVTSQANNAFVSLLAETKLAFDQNTKNLTLGSKLVSKSTTPNIPSTAVGIEFGSNSPISKWCYEIQFPQLKGKVNEFNYLADKVKFVLEVTIIENKDTGKALKHPQNDSANSTSWDKVFGAGLIAASAVVVVGTLIEDYVSLGFGAADDPVCFATAAGMSARGAMLWGSARVVIQRAVLPAMARFSVSIVPVATLKYAH